MRCRVFFSTGAPFVSTLTIIVNDSPRAVAAGATVASLLELLQLKPRFLAIELNRQVVPRSEHHRTVLAEGDRIEIVTLVGGG